MIDPFETGDPDRVRLANAAWWLVRLNEAGVDSTPEFAQWIAEPENADAWARVSEPWIYIGEHASAPELVAARKLALRSAERANARRRVVGSWRAIAAGIAATLVVGLGVWAGLWWFERPDEYTTAVDERRIIMLADGSRVSLDSSSEVSVHYTRSARELQLLRGQARFDVAHDKTRPFSVLAGSQKVIATGTIFNIDMAGPKVLVTLIEGHVVVLDEKMPDLGDAIKLKAGEQLTAASAGERQVEPANIQRTTAWVKGQLMFDNEALSSVVERVDRYTTVPISIADARTGALRISGVFNTGDVNGFVDTVTHYLPVEALPDKRGAVELRAKGD